MHAGSTHALKMPAYFIPSRMLMQGTGTRQYTCGYAAHLPGTKFESRGIALDLGFGGGVHVLGGCTEESLANFCPTCFGLQEVKMGDQTWRPTGKAAVIGITKSAEMPTRA